MRIRKFLSIMLTICLVATLIPFTEVRAAESEDGASEFTYSYAAIGNTGAVITVTSGQEVTATVDDESLASVSVVDSAITVTGTGSTGIATVSIDYGADESCVVEVPLGYTTFVFDGDNLTVYKGSDTNYEISGVNAANDDIAPTGTTQEDSGILYTNDEAYSLSVDIKKKGGTYVFTGETDNMSIAVKKEATAAAVLLLASLDMTSEITSPITVKRDSTSAASVEIRALAGHTNYLEDAELNDADKYGPANDDGSGGDGSNPEYAESAVIKCKASAKVTIDGSGTLELNCVTKNAIKVGTSGTLTIKDLTLNVTSAGNGISSDNTMDIQSGTINVVAEGDGIRSDPDEGTTDAGTITVSGGTISIDAGSDGVQAATDISVTGGDIYIDADCDGLKSASETGVISLTGGQATVWSAEPAEESTNMPVNCYSLEISGATVFAAGSAMTTTISEDSQAYVSCTDDIASGQTINVNCDDETVYTTSAVKAVNYVLYSSPDMASGSWTIAVAADDTGDDDEEQAEAVSLNISEVSAPVATTDNTYKDAGGIEALTDGDESTIYHSMYGSEMAADPDNAVQYDAEESSGTTAVLTGNNELVFTLRTTATVSGFNYLTKSGNGAILSYEIYVAGTDGEYTQVASGDWDSDSTWKNVTFDPVKSVKYVKLVAKKTYTTELSSGHAFVAGREIQVMGVSDCECYISDIEAEDVSQDVDFGTEGSYKYTFDSSALTITKCDLHSDETPAITYEVVSAGTTGATAGEDGVTFTATGTATITITASLGYTSVEKTITVTLTDDTAGTGDTEDTKTITSVEVYVTTPEPNATQDTVTATVPDDAHYSVVDIEWYPNGGYDLMEDDAVFEEGGSYEAAVVVEIDDGYEFADEVTALFNGEFNESDGDWTDYFYDENYSAVATKRYVAHTFTIDAPTTRAALEDAINEYKDFVESLDSEEYTESSYNAAVSALENAISVYEDSSSSKSAMESATKKLTNAVAALQTKLEYITEQLTSLVSAANELAENKDAYTEESYAPFETALGEAESALANEAATVTELQEAYDSLNAAKEALVTQESVAQQAAQAELETAVDSYEATYSAEQGDYTDETWDDFVKAYEAAKAALSDPDSYTSEELSALLANLDSAQAALATASSSGTDSTGSSSDGDTSAATTGGTTTTTDGTGSSTAAVDTTLAKGDTVSFGNFIYKVTGDNTVQVTGLTAEGKKLKTLTIYNSVTLGSTSFKVTAIAKNAFKGNKKITSVTIGKNITSIGAKAFYGCKKLKKVTVKSKVLKKVGKAAFKGVSSKITVKVPKAKKTAYTKLLKKGGIKASKIK